MLYVVFQWMRERAGKPARDPRQGPGTGR